MNKIILGFLMSVALHVQALEVGDVYQSQGNNIVHLNPNGTETQSDIFSLNSGHKKLFVEFFQTTCYYCIVNRPEFLKLANEFSSTVTSKFIGIDKKEDVLRIYFQTIKSQLTVPYVLDNQRFATKAFVIQGTPTSFILDENGKVIFKHEGTFSDDDKNEIRQLLK